MPRGNLGDFLDWWVVLRSLIDAPSGAHARRGHVPGSFRRAARPHAQLRSGRRRRRDRGVPRGSRLPPPPRLVRLRADGRDLRRHGPRAADVHARRRSLVVGEDRRRRRPVRAHAVLPRALEPRARAARQRAVPAHRPVSSTTATLPRATGNRIEALVKPIGVVEGISDVPWHKDCSLGMHSYRCCGLTCGISVTGRRRPLGAAACRRGFAPRARPARVRAQQLRPADHRSARPRPATSPCTAAARSTCRSRRSTASGG